MRKITLKSAGVIFISLFMLFSYAASSRAYKLETAEYGNPLHWTPDKIPVEYRITNAPPINADVFIQAIQNAFNTWQAVPSASITFRYAGTTGTRKPAYDGVNNIITKNKVSGSDVVGQTYIYYTVDEGVILDADIVLNSSYPWSTDGAPGKMDVQNAATHEIGHFCCLDDLYSDADKEKTMYGYIDYGETKKRTLDPDDMAGLASVYPAGSSDSDDSGGGSGCGTVSSGHPPPGPHDINFLWLFLLLLVLGTRYIFMAREKSPSR